VKTATLPSLGVSMVAVALARVALRVAPARTVRWAAARNASTSGASPTPGAVPSLAWGVAAAGAVLRASCLEQAVALTAILGIARIPARLVSGVSRSGRALDAHAWVESSGAIVLGAAEATRYSAFPTAAR
jgi:transglutaminase-like putative cysteine protease